MIRKLVLAAGLAALSAPALAADTYFYGALDFMRAEVSTTALLGPGEPDRRLNGGALSAGYQLLPFLAVEGRVAQTRSGGDPVEVKLDNALSLFAKGIWALDPGRIHPYLLVGATRAEIKVREAGPSLTSTRTELSYGVGVDLWATERLGMKLEYTRYLHSSDRRIEAPHIGFIMRF